MDERGEEVGDDGIMSSHPPSFVRNRLKDESNLLLSGASASQGSTSPAASNALGG